MKKTIVFAIALGTIGAFSTEAKAQSDKLNSTQQPQTIEQTQQNDKKQQITAEALPEPVKEMLKNDALKDWQVSEVYKVAPDAQVTDAKATYEIHFTNAEQKKAIARFDEEGKVIAGKEGK
ncbi:hypothetical protein ACFSRY_09765 [Pontibacter locisalis]|uniref:PepSY domain-containing protein n=1 Tax=Pontibacter locisalis TaxID=1719035 RepID=A0ABW5IMB3_9BACT